MAKKKSDLRQLIAQRARESKQRYTESDKVKETLLRLPITIPLQNTLRPDRALNFLHMSVGDTGISLVDSKTDTRVGEVIGNMGGSVTVIDHKRGEQWTLRMADLWEVYTGARAQLGALPPLPAGQARAIPDASKIKTARFNCKGKRTK